MQPSLRTSGTMLHSPIPRLCPVHLHTSPHIKHHLPDLSNMYILEYVQALLQVPPQQTPATPPPTHPAPQPTQRPSPKPTARKAAPEKPTTTASSTSPNDRTWFWEPHPTPNSRMDQLETRTHAILDITTKTPRPPKPPVPPPLPAPQSTHPPPSVPGHPRSQDHTANGSTDTSSPTSCPVTHHDYPCDPDHDILADDPEPAPEHLRIADLADFRQPLPRQRSTPHHPKDRCTPSQHRRRPRSYQMCQRASGRLHSP